VLEFVEIVSDDEFAGDVVQFYSHVFWAIKGGAKVEVFRSKLANFAIGWERTLLRRIFTNSKEPVFVPQLPG
jgi:hypothetical protein